MTEPAPPFVRPLPTGTQPSMAPPLLDPQTEHDLRAALDDIARCRDQAWVAGQTYLIHGVPR